MRQLDDTLLHISNASDTEIAEIIQAVIRRYGAVHPGWEVMFLSLPKDNPSEQERIIQAALGLLTRKI